MTCNFFGNAPLNTAGNAFALISENEVLTLFLHDGGFLFRHRTADQIRTAQRITAQGAYNLHNLLLIDNTAISLF